MTKQDLIRMMMEELGYSRRDSKAFIDKVFSIMIDSILKKESIKITNFGSFVVRIKGKRIGRNPKTKKEYIIKDRAVVVFKPSIGLRKELKMK
jgi:integration host factor subunit alpha